MADYSKMSDFEINKAIAEYKLDGDWLLEPTDDRRFTFFNLGVASKRTAELPNYCNNPSDAWPIIVENKISVMFDRSVEYGDSSEWCLASSPCDRYIVDYVSSDKLLRAAMIVYLMMKESENG